ncbi:unnamed protein product [Gongylonema pulchrum]|uniref:SCP domain-containing protein n=1 Tax=Gongylonema pulchrum TaxID=637853 RepID=A0A183EAK5_9BILA|nr:unnamed protein product [Gongylonema pulchrum]
MSNYETMNSHKQKLPTGNKLYKMHAVTFDLRVAGLKATNGWWDELEDLYDYEANPDNIITRDMSTTGVAHWTQMAWDETKQIGCGISNCNSQIIVVCHYMPM